MTTTVTIKTHDWPVKVQPLLSGTEQVVEPHTERQFYIHQSQGLLITELPLPTKEPS